MIKHLGIVGCFFAVGWAYGQFVQVAPDLCWTDAMKCYVGVANPVRESVQVEITGYRDDGTVVGTESLTLGPLGRKEWGAIDLFGSSDVSWARVESSVELGGYVRFEHEDGRRVSLAPMVASAGPEVWIPHIARDTDQFFTDVVLANVSSEAGQPLSQPFQDNLDDEGPAWIQRDTPLAITGSAQALEQIRFDYESLYGADTRRLQWDLIYNQDGMAFMGVQHFGKKTPGVSQQASLALPAAPTNELIISHVSRDNANFWTGLVLINSLPTILPLEIVSYSDNGQVFQVFNMELLPFEKKTYLIDNLSEIGFSNIAAWYHISAYESGLLGYELFGSPDDRVMAGLEAAPKPSTMCVLPYTPSTDTLWTGVGVINTGDVSISPQIAGLDDQGRVVAVMDDGFMEAKEKWSFTTDEWFGDRASEVTWMRIDAEGGNLSAFALVGDRDRNFLSGLQGIPNQALRGRVFLANFEYDDIELMDAVGWTQYRYYAPDWNDEVHDRGFHIDRHYAAENGVTNLYYEPLLSIIPNAGQFPWDVSIYVAPAVSIPDDEKTYYLSFYMRIMDHETANPGGAYGLVWRLEGHQTWNWFGLKSDVLMVNPPGCDFRDRARGVMWHGQPHTLTEWIPFQVQLPDSARGARIEVGAYYQSQIGMDTLYRREPAPIMFIDTVQIAADPLPYHEVTDPPSQGVVVFPD